MSIEISWHGFLPYRYQFDAYHIRWENDILSHYYAAMSIGKVALCGKRCSYRRMKVSKSMHSGSLSWKKTSPLKDGRILSVSAVTDQQGREGGDLQCQLPPALYLPLLLT